MDILRLILLALHILGLAVIIGTFVVQMRANSGFRTDLILGGAITQVVTGVALVGVDTGLGHAPDYAKITVKLAIALVVLVTAIIAVVNQRRGKKVKPLFHTAGGLAVVNVLVAVLWQ